MYKKRERQGGGKIFVDICLAWSRSCQDLVVIKYRHEHNRKFSEYQFLLTERKA